MNSNTVLLFWFTELTPKQHFTKDAALDAVIAHRFGATLEAGSRCELFSWRATPAGRLAEIIVLDQFSRNVWRDTPRAFAQDALALALAQELVARGDDALLPIEQRRFAYMPYIHSESLAIHQEALRLFAQVGLEDTLDAEQRHLAILQRFGHTGRSTSRPTWPTLAGADGWAGHQAGDRARSTYCAGSPWT